MKNAYALKARQGLSLPVSLTPTRRKTIVVEIDADRFEKLASDLHLFGEEFLESLGQAEREIVQGKTKKLRSLKELRSL